MVLCQRVGVDGDKEVGLGIVGNLGTTIQGDEDIRLARIDHLHVRATLLNEAAQLEGHVQVDVLLLGDFPYGTGVVPAVPGVDDDCKIFCSHFGSKKRQTEQADAGRDI